MNESSASNAPNASLGQVSAEVRERTVPMIPDIERLGQRTQAYALIMPDGGVFVGDGPFPPQLASLLAEAPSTDNPGIMPMAICTVLEHLEPGSTGKAQDATQTLQNYLVSVNGAVMLNAPDASSREQLDAALEEAIDLLTDFVENAPGDDNESPEDDDDEA
jgi:hypothetical protein